MYRNEKQAFAGLYNLSARFVVGRLNLDSICRLDVQGSFCMTCHTMCETQYGHNVSVLGGCFWPRGQRLPLKLLGCWQDFDFVSYSSKPTGGVGTSQAQSSGSTLGLSKHGISAVDWMCTVCGCVNFARRMLCFQVANSQILLVNYQSLLDDAICWNVDLVWHALTV